MVFLIFFQRKSNKQINKKPCYFIPIEISNPYVDYLKTIDIKFSKCNKKAHTESESIYEKCEIKAHTESEESESESLIVA